jgi:RHS repeat-associated protein
MISHMVLRPLRSRRVRRRVFTIATTFACLVGTLTQQTRAVELWPSISRPLRLSFGHTEWDIVKNNGQRAVASFMRWFGRFTHPLFRSGDPEPYKAGAPKPWQAADPAGPSCVVNLATGNLFCQVPVVSWEGVSFSLYYNSLEAPDVPTLSPGWSRSYSGRLDGLSATPLEFVHYIAGDGTKIKFEGDEEDFEEGVTDPIHRLTLKLDSAVWILIDAGRNRMEFDGAGALTSIVDSSGNTTALTYGGGSGELTEIRGPGEDIGTAYERTLVLGIDAGKLASATAPSLFNADGSEVVRHFEFSYDEYNDDALDRIYSPRRDGPLPGGVPLFHIQLAYDVTDGLQSITDYRGNATEYAYDGSGWVELVTYPEVYDWVLEQGFVPTREYEYDFDGAEGTTVVTDAREGETTYDFDQSGRVVLVTDPLERDVAALIWNSDNRVTSSTNVLGGTTTFDYDANGNPIEIDGPMVSDVTTADFDEYNRLEWVEDPSGYRVSFTYGSISGDNPMHPIAFSGDGDADEVVLAWEEGGIKAGLPKHIIDPNGNSQGFTYVGRVLSEYIDQRAVDPLRDAGPHIGQDFLSGPTGEVAISGRQAELCCLESFGGGRGCDPYPCPTCGCGTTYDESGLAVGKSPDQCHGPTASGLRGAVHTCGDFGQPYSYDGDGRLECAIDTVSQDGRKHVLEYDELGRMVHGAVLPPLATGYGVPPDAFMWTFPAVETYVDYSDSTGSTRVRYLRTVDEADCDPLTGCVIEHREFDIVYETDAAGRVVAITRTDYPLSKVSQPRTIVYGYEDSTLLPAVTETRPDGTSSSHYVDAAGRVLAIVHLDANEDEILVYEYERDEMGRIVEVLESVRHDHFPGGYRQEYTEYAYGSGTLPGAALDSSGSAVQWSKRHYAHLNILGYDEVAESGKPLLSSNPHRLVSEVRYSALHDLDPEWLENNGGALEYLKEYSYDPAGNRLTMVVSDLDDELMPVTRSITRYNYAYGDVLDESAATEDLPPGTPDTTGPLVMDYEGNGMNKLLSTQTFFFDEEGTALTDRVEVERFIYRDAAALELEPHDSANLAKVNESDIALRIRTFYAYDGGEDEWLNIAETKTYYRYRDGRLDIRYARSSWECGEIDRCESAFAEQNVYDVFGRRVAHTATDEAVLESGLTQLDGELEEVLEDAYFALEVDSASAAVVNYDYLGPSQTVLAERRGPGYKGEDLRHVTQFAQDRFIATYTPGPLGLAERVDEAPGAGWDVTGVPGIGDPSGGNADTDDNLVYYLLTDAQGASVVTMPQDGFVEMDLSVQLVDAFGVAVKTEVASSEWLDNGPWLGQAGSYQWRGSEGSESDLHLEPRVADAGEVSGAGADWWENLTVAPATAALVLMQARHYDPSLGRFIQADRLAVASPTTQGMNRYIYCENDPVNYSDAQGMSAGGTLSMILVGAAFAVGAAVGLYIQSVRGGWLGLSKTAPLAYAGIGGACGQVALDLLLKIPAAAAVGTRSYPKTS